MIWALLDGPWNVQSLRQLALANVTHWAWHLWHEVNAYRSEIQGCHAGLLGLLAFVTYHDIHGGLVTCGIDNDLSLDTATEGHLNILMPTKHADWNCAIQWIVSILKANFSIKIDFFHVEDHQDDFIPFLQLSWLAQLNVLMDEKAKARVDHRTAARAPPPPSMIGVAGLGIQK
jgi:hypothetical protein